MSAPFVTFSGLDGCGKSTQLELLAEQLSGRGVRVARVWSRGGYTPGVLWLKRVARRVMGRRAPPPGKGRQRDATLGNPLVRAAWLDLALLDLIRLYGVELRLRALRGEAVLCDRYLWDTLVDFRVNFPGVDVTRRPLWRVLERVARRPDLAIYLALDPELSERRAIEKNDPFPEPMEARVRRRSAYEALLHRFTVLDARRPREGLHAEILARLATPTPHRRPDP